MGPPEAGSGKVVLTPVWVESGGAAQVAQVRRTVTRKRKKTAEVVYVITSDANANAAILATWPSALPGLDGHANTAAADRHHARDPRRTLTLLQSA